MIWWNILWVIGRFFRKLKFILNKKSDSLGEPASTICEIIGIIQTIGKHVIAQQTLAGGGEGVGIEEAGNGGVIVAGLEVIESVPLVSTGRIRKRKR